jgi:hypothetical protein
MDIAKQLGLPGSTLNTIVTKKNDIREQIQKCGNMCKKRNTGKESTFLIWKQCSSRQDLRSFRKS